LPVRPSAVPVFGQADGRVGQIANELMGSLTYAREKLEKEGATDLSYSIPAVFKTRPIS